MKLNININVIQIPHHFNFKDIFSPFVRLSLCFLFASQLPSSSESPEFLEVSQRPSYHQPVTAHYCARLTNFHCHLSEDATGYGPIFEEEPVDVVYIEDSPDNRISMNCRARANPPAAYRLLSQVM